MALLLATACASPSRPTLTPAVVEWPDGLIERLGHSSDDAYGWQRCGAAVGEDDRPRENRAVGMFDPASDSGVMIVETLRSDGSTYQQQWALDAGVIETNAVGGEGAARERIALETLRSVQLFTDQFDFETIAPDAVDPSRARPVVQAIDSGDAQTTLRLEGLPSAWPRATADNEPERFAAFASLAPDNANSSYVYGPGVLWLVDVWADGDDVERLRFQIQDSTEYREPRYTELRFVDVDQIVSDGQVQLHDCPAKAEAGNEDWRAFEPWNATRTIPLDISLDPEGRPYDTTLFDGTTVRREVVGELAVPNGELVVMDGNAIQVDPSFFRDGGSVPVVAAPTRIVDDLHFLDVAIVWEVWDQLDPDGKPFESVLGVRLGASTARVATWDPFEDAYGTDGGTGGVMATSVFDIAEQLGDRMLIEEPNFDAQYEFFDLDGVPGDDTFTFSNGFGDGGFPMSRGRDAAGEVVAIMIWRAQVPWRLAVPEGIPPADVALREENLIECLNGQRQIDVQGNCEFDT